MQYDNLIGLRQRVSYTSNTSRSTGNGSESTCLVFGLVEGGENVAAGDVVMNSKSQQRPHVLVTAMVGLAIEK